LIHMPWGSSINFQGQRIPCRQARRGP
jgi:hypothetical protein